MLKNMLPLTQEDEPNQDWSSYHIDIIKLNRQRFDCLNAGRYYDAHTLWFRIADLELDLRNAICARIK
jgi:hypothetical protein